MTLRIGLDLDGVVYEWSKTARYLLRTQRGLHHLVGEPTCWDWNVEEAVPGQDWDWLWSVGVEKYGLFRHGHLVKGAIEGVRALNQRGYDVVVITHRPRNAVRDTVAFLDYHFGGEDPYPFRDIHLLTDKQPKSSIPADIYIDDSPYNIHELLESSDADVVIFDQPWNRDTLFEEVGAERALDWPECVSLITDIEAGW